MIADIFISVEEDLYKAAENSGGWRAFKQFKIARTEEESDEVTSFYFVPVDGSKVPAYKAGQYVSLRVTVPYEEYMLNRQYTLSQPSNAQEFRISVKRENADHVKGKYPTSYMTPLLARLLISVIQQVFSFTSRHKHLCYS